MLNKKKTAYIGLYHFLKTSLKTFVLQIAERSIVTILEKHFASKIGMPPQNLDALPLQSQLGMYAREIRASGNDMP